MFAEELNKNAVINKSISLVNSPQKKPKNRLSSKLYYIKTLRFLRSYIKENNISHVHVHFANLGYLYLGLKSRDLRYAVSFYGYDYESLSYENNKWTKAYKSLFSEADLFFCEGEHGAQRLIHLGCDKEKVRVQKLGVRKEHIQFLKRKKKKNSLKLIQIASFAEKKGQIHSVNAIKNICKECPNISLSFYGNIRDSAYYRTVIDLIAQHGLEEHILGHDYLDYTKLHETLANFDVFIHPSCYAHNRDCEGGAPTILLDAQATGMPIISTMHCDIPNTVLHGKTGLLSEEKNLDQLSEHIKQFYKMDEEEYNAFSYSATAYIEENYDIQKNLLSLRYE